MNRSIRSSLFAAVAAFGTLALGATTATAEDAASFYKGKTMTFITPGSPGGGYDTYMREMIPHLEKKLGATIVPINEPGGGHLLAVNKTYSAAPDGLTILLNDGEASLLGIILDVPAARYDLSKMNWIARVNGESAWFSSPSLRPMRRSRKPLAVPRSSSSAPPARPTRRAWPPPWLRKR